jgi:hypothetical protein
VCTILYHPIVNIIRDSTYILSILQDIAVVVQIGKIRDLVSFKVARPLGSSSQAAKNGQGFRGNITLKGNPFTERGN